MIDIATFGQCRILVVGDLMLDEYVWGDVERISPEAPVQVVAVRREDHTLGGAGNVAANLVALGAKVAVAGVVGNDRHGTMLTRRFQSLGVDTAGIVAEEGRLTTRKTRIIAVNQQVLRIDRETRQAVAAATVAGIGRHLAAEIDSAQVVLVSDYGKGLLTDELLAEIIAAARLHAKPVLVDPKGLDYARYAGATLITPNRKETGLAAGIDIVDDATLARAAEKIRRQARLDQLLITCGSDGMVLFRADRPPYVIRSEARQVFDVSGAGDTVLAVLGLALAAGADLPEAATLANTAAGIVVGKVGTATVTRKELALARQPFAADHSHKFKSLTEIGDLAADMHRQGKRVVMTNGCFDFLHAGHLHLFAASRRMGDLLIVAIDDDESVRALKGPGRPVISARERVRTLCALDTVDAVVVFASRDLERLIDIVKPDVLSKGSNYAADQVVGRQRVEAHGGRVVLIPVSAGVSASAVIDSIRSSASPGRQFDAGPDDA